MEKGYSGNGARMSNDMAWDALRVWKMKSLKDKEALSRVGLIG